MNVIMWICKKCNTKNEDIYHGCIKCNKKRIYPFEPLRFLMVTLALSGISISGLVLAIHYSSMLLLAGVLFLYFFLSFPLVADYEPKYSSVISIVISFILGIAAMIALGEFTFRKYFEVYESTIETISYITLSVSILGIVLYLAYEFRKNQKERQKIVEEYRAKEKLRKEEERKKYGVPTKVIQPYGYDHHFPCVRVFSEKNIIEVNRSKIKFEDIVDYHVGENVTSELQMSKSGMMTRGIIGGLLYGKVGAFVGAATADKYLQTNVDYTICIRLKNGAARYVRTEDPIFVDELCAVLESIIC